MKAHTYLEKKIEEYDQPINEVRYFEKIRAIHDIRREQGQYNDDRLPHLDRR